MRQRSAAAPSLLCALWATFVVALAALAPAVAGAGALVVQVQTDYRPQVDFDTVRSRVGNESSAVLATAEEYFFAFESLGGGVRVAEFDLPPGEYLLYVELRDAKGQAVAARPVRVAISEQVLIHTVTFARELRDVTKRDTLFLDLDDDGGASPGDTVLYTVEIPGPQEGGSFEDTPGRGSRLIAGSVLTSHGIVSEGNEAGDDSVAVGFGPLAAGETAVVSFFVEVLPLVVGNQGSLLAVQGSTSDRFQTNDPDTLKFPDATYTTLSGGDASECTAELAIVSAQLMSITGDSDGDGVANARDDCDGTPAGQPVDARGCSPSQFCESAVVGSSNVALACGLADWRDDDLWLFPNDCRVQQGACEAL